MSRRPTEKTSTLRVEYRFHSSELAATSLPVEIRKPNMALVARGLASQEFQVPPGTYDVLARMPGGQEMSARVEVKGATVTALLQPEAGEDSPREEWEAPLLLRGGGLGLTSAFRQADLRQGLEAAVAGVRGRLRLFEGNLLEAAVQPVPESTWVLRPFPEVLAQFTLPGSAQVRLAQLLLPGEVPRNVALPASPGRDCRLAIRQAVGTPVRLEVHLSNPQADALLGMEEQGNSAGVSLAADMRVLHRASLPVSALGTEAAGAAEALLDQKQGDPIAAAAGAYALLRFGDLDRLHDWTENLKNWFDWLPDGAAVRGEHLAREGEHTAALEAFLLLEYRGLPFFSDGLSFALDRLRLYTRLEDAPFAAEKVERARRLLENLARFAPFVDFRRPILAFTGLVPGVPDDQVVQDDQLDALGGLDLSLYLESLPPAAAAQIPPVPRPAPTPETRSKQTFTTAVESGPNTPRPAAIRRPPFPRHLHVRLVAALREATTSWIALGARVRSEPVWHGASQQQFPRRVWDWTSADGILRGRALLQQDRSLSFLFASPEKSLAGVEIELVSDGRKLGSARLALSPAGNEVGARISIYDPATDRIEVELRIANPDEDADE